MFCLKKRKTKAVFKKCARPETKPTGRKAKGKRNPMTPTTSSVYPTTPMMINIPTI